MAKITIPDIASQFASQEALNARFTQVENELNDKVLYRDNPDGEPNAMVQELDMNSKRIINLPEPIHPNDAARLQDLTTATLDPSTVIPTFSEGVSLTAGQLLVNFPTYQTEGSSFSVSGPNVDDARLVQGRDFTVTSSTDIRLTQSYPAGTLIQLLRNAISGDEAAGVSYSQVEEIPLVDSQTTAVFSVLSTQYAGFYVSGPDVDAGRLAPSDYSWVNNTTIELAQSYPTGSTLTLLRNSTEADMADYAWANHADYGLGTTTFLDYPKADLDDPSCPSGFYRVIDGNPSLGTRPPGLNPYGYIQVYTYTLTEKMQVITDVFNRTATRLLKPGGNTAWKETAHVGDYLPLTGGTVSGGITITGDVTANGTISEGGTLLSTKYARLDAGNNFTSGIHGFYSETGELIEGVGSITKGLEVYQPTAGYDAMMQFHIGGDYAVKFGLDSSTKKLAVGGFSMGAVSHAIYHEGNKPTLNDLTGSGTGATWSSGTGTPEGIVSAVVGSMYTRTDGGVGSTLYVKESGSGNTGWAAK